MLRLEDLAEELGPIHLAVLSDAHNRTRAARRRLEEAAEVKE